MRSNSYTLIFTAAVTIVLGLLLSLSSTALKQRQDLNIENDIKKNILQSLGFSASKEKPWNTETVQTLFAENIIGIVVDEKGKTVKGKQPQDLNPDTDLNLYPVFIKKINGQVEGYAIPISGKGLWSTIYGYFAFEPDGKTVKGLTFYKHGETPGLGGELEKQWFRDNFIGKRFIDEKNKLVSIQIVKGKVDNNSENAFHQVDGISGATMTAKGINIFLLKNLQNYEGYFSEVRTGGGI